jgi:hypothetical protein
VRRGGTSWGGGGGGKKMMWGVVRRGRYRLGEERAV